MTDIEICNMALGQLGTAGIASLDDDSDEARACKTFYGPVRDAVLSDAAWSFALGLRVLNPDADAPIFKWAYKFTVPSDVARVHRADDGTGEYRMQWEVLDNAVHADSTPVYVEVVRKVTDTSKYSPAFCMALATRLAAELCIPLTENRALHGDLWALYEKKIKAATRTDGSQGKSERIRSDYLKRVR